MANLYLSHFYRFLKAPAGSYKGFTAIKSIKNSISFSGFIKPQTAKALVNTDLFWQFVAIKTVRSFDALVP